MNPPREQRLTPTSPGRPFSPWGQGGRRVEDAPPARWADEGAFTRRQETPPHQFGRMTYSRALEGQCAASEVPATVSHGLTSSPQGERGSACPDERTPQAERDVGETGARVSSFSPWGEGGRRPDEGAFTQAVAPHQFGQMTYGLASRVARIDREEHEAVSHGLTSSPPRGERGQPRRQQQIDRALGRHSALGETLSRSAPNSTLQRRCPPRIVGLALLCISG